MYLFILSGGIFVAGAIGLELIGALQDDSIGKENLVYCLLYSAEETLEMLGIATFIFALLRYISDQFNGIQFRVHKELA